MEMEQMFTEQRWNILSQLSEKKQSPIQLAKELNTTMANISQQLRLLEATNLVQKEKIKNRDKGKPRTLFSLTDDYAYLVSAMPHFADKRLLRVTPQNQAKLKIWFVEDTTLHYAIEKLYWDLEPFLSEIDLIAVDQSAKKLIVAANDTQKVEAKTKDAGITVSILSRNQLQRLLKQNTLQSSQGNIVVLHDLHNQLIRGDACN